MDEDLSMAASKFQAHIDAGIPRLRRLGYSPTEFKELMRAEGGAVGATRRLLGSPQDTSYGFERLYALGQLSASVEFAALLPWFEPLFSAEELREARERLVTHDFPVDAKLQAAAASPPEWSYL